MSLDENIDEEEKKDEENKNDDKENNLNLKTKNKKQTRKDKEKQEEMSIDSGIPDLENEHIRSSDKAEEEIRIEKNSSKHRSLQKKGKTNINDLKFIKLTLKNLMK